MGEKSAVELRITRAPEVRVVLGEFDSSVIQVLGEERPLHIRGTEHGLWTFARVFSNVTTDAFAEHAIELMGSQALRMSSVEARAERVAAELVTARHQLKTEHAVREYLERELTSREGLERANAKIAEIIERSKRSDLRTGGDA